MSVQPCSIIEMISMTFGIRGSKTKVFKQI